jgi:hypothetical protein
MSLSRHSHNLSHTITGTVNMGLNYPSTIFEVFPGDSFRLVAKNLTRFLPQVAPTMHDVFLGIDTYQVPWRQLFDKLGISWDDFLTGGEDGLSNLLMPTITIPAGGFEPGSLADWLNLPTNYIDPATGSKVIVGAGLTVCALPVVAYMHIINENYRDQNFIKKLDLTKYEDFINGDYVFEDASGTPLGYDFLVNGVFPKAWSRDYFGRALPNTQRGPEVQLPISGSVGLTPPIAPVISTSTIVAGSSTNFVFYLSNIGFPNSSLTVSFDLFGFSGTQVVQPLLGLSFSLPQGYSLPLNKESFVGTLQCQGTVWSFYFTPTGTGQSAGTLRVVRTSGDFGDASYSGSSYFLTNLSSGSSSVVDLSSVEGLQSTSASIIAFRLAARMQAFGEMLQRSGARAVEFTLAMFGVRIPDERIQRPIFHGSFVLPVVFSEVLQTSSTDATSPQGNLAGHGITGGMNRPIHIKVLEHGYVVSIMHIMPRSQYQNILPRMYDRLSRFDVPNPIFQHVGEQGIKRKEIYPNSANPEEYFGYVPRYSELMHIPSTLHGHMKDTFLHWTMARLYNNGEPVLSAAWRYEKPTDRSFSVKNEDQVQIQIGYEINGRRLFSGNPQPGIHIV